MPSSPQLRSASNAERIRVSIPTNRTCPQCFSIDSILPRTAPDIFPTTCAFNQEIETTGSAKTTADIIDESDPVRLVLVEAHWGDIVHTAANPVRKGFLFL